MENTGLFEKYVNMIRKMAHYYSNMYHVDYYELEAQGYLIYCKALNKYDASKSCFSSYLYTYLKDIGKYAKRYNDNSVQADDDFLENIPDFEKPSVNDLLDDAKTYLSMEAYNLLKYILSWKWEKKRRRIPTVKSISNDLGISRYVINRLWNECKLYWCDKGCLLY